MLANRPLPRSGLVLTLTLSLGWPVAGVGHWLQPWAGRACHQRDAAVQLQALRDEVAVQARCDIVLRVRGWPAARRAGVRHGDMWQGEHYSPGSTYGMACHACLRCMMATPEPP